MQASLSLGFLSSYGNLHLNLGWSRWVLLPCSLVAQGLPQGRIPARVSGSTPGKWCVETHLDAAEGYS
eukprot:4115088-Amphidinium_carterae.1